MHPVIDIKSGKLRLQFYQIKLWTLRIVSRQVTLSLSTRVLCVRWICVALVCVAFTCFVQLSCQSTAGWGPPTTVQVMGVIWPSFTLQVIAGLKVGSGGHGGIGSACGGRPSTHYPRSHFLGIQDLMRLGTFPGDLIWYGVTKNGKPSCISASLANYFCKKQDQRNWKKSFFSYTIATWSIVLIYSRALGWATLL